MQEIHVYDHFVVEKSLALSGTENQCEEYSLPGQLSSRSTYSLGGTAGLAAWIPDENNHL